MDNPRTLDPSGNNNILSRNAWLIIMFAILFILYAFVPPFQDPVNSLIGAMFGPLIDMIGLVMDSMSYI